MTDRMAPGRRRYLLSTAGCIGAVVLLAQPALAGVNDLPPVSDETVAASVSPIKAEVVPLRIADSVKPLEQTVRQGSETILRLSSDILFAFGQATVTPAANARISALVAKVPRSASLGVSGYTDNVGSPTYNLGLSARRAQAVAALVRAARPDLKLAVRGYGEASPVAPNSTGDKDDPAARSLNRRVELGYRR